MNESGLDWMQTETTLEEELTLENATRSIRDQIDLEELKVLCLTLFRSNFHQRKLLLQAVTRIAYLEDDDWNR